MQTHVCMTFFLSFFLQHHNTIKAITNKIVKTITKDIVVPIPNTAKIPANVPAKTPTKNDNIIVITAIIIHMHVQSFFLSFSFL